MRAFLPARPVDFPIPRLHFQTLRDLADFALSCAGIACGSSFVFVSRTIRKRAYSSNIMITGAVVFFFDPLLR